MILRLSREQYELVSELAVQWQVSLTNDLAAARRLDELPDNYLPELEAVLERARELVDALAVSALRRRRRRSPRLVRRVFSSS